MFSQFCCLRTGIIRFSHVKRDLTFINGVPKIVSKAFCPHTCQKMRLQFWWVNRIAGHFAKMSCVLINFSVAFDQNEENYSSLVTVYSLVI